MNTGLIIGIISLSLVSIVVVVVIRMNKKTSPTPTSAAGRGGEPTITQNNVTNYTKLYEYLSPSGISGKEVSGYKVDKPYGKEYAYSLLNTSSYNITKVGFNFNTTQGYIGTGVWLYKLDKNKVASPSTTWTTIYGNKLYIQDILIEPGESFVIDMRQIRDTANFEITFVEVGPSNEPTVGPSNTSDPTQAPSNTSVPPQVKPTNYTKLYEYLSPSSPSGISGKEVSGYKVDKPSGTPYAYSLLNTSSYNITKVGFNFNTTLRFQGTSIWLYKLDKNKVASQGDSWTTLYGNKSYIQNILIEPGESFVIDMRNITLDPANFEITFVEVLLPG